MLTIPAYTTGSQKGAKFHANLVKCFEKAAGAQNLFGLPANPFCDYVLHLVSCNSFFTHFSVIGIKYWKEVSCKLIVASTPAAGSSRNKLHTLCCLLRHCIVGKLGLCSYRRRRTPANLNKSKLLFLILSILSKYFLYHD